MTNELSLKGSGTGGINLFLKTYSLRSVLHVVKEMQHVWKLNWAWLSTCASGRGHEEEVLEIIDNLIRPFRRAEWVAKTWNYKILWSFNKLYAFIWWVVRNELTLLLVAFLAERRTSNCSKLELNWLVVVTSFGTCPRQPDLINLSSPPVLLV
jgi:hypothetical protein